MQISYLTTNYQNTTPAQPKNAHKTNLFLKAASAQTEQKFYAKNLAALGVNFKGNSDDDKTLEQLKNEYTWYVNADKTKPLDAFLKIKTDKEGMNKLFCSILEDENLSYNLIDDIAGRARDARKNYTTLRQLLGDNSDNLKFFLPDNPYGKAFEKSYDAQILLLYCRRGFKTKSENQRIFNKKYSNQSGYSYKKSNFRTVAMD